MLEVDTKLELDHTDPSMEVQVHMSEQSLHLVLSPPYAMDLVEAVVAHQRVEVLSKLVMLVMNQPRLSHHWEDLVAPPPSLALPFLSLALIQYSSTAP